MLPDGTIEQSPVSMTVTAIGELAGGGSTRCTRIQAELATGGIEVGIVEDIRAAMWQKLFGFACNAAITTLTRSRAGILAKTAAGTQFVNDILAEATRILEAEGYRPAEQTLGLIQGLFAQTGSNYAPSLFVDMA
jgi:2-dehydropantoate 2-reductase